MDYYKLNISLVPLEEWPRDTIITYLSEIGFIGFVETNKGFETYIQADNYIEDDLSRVLLPFRQKHNIGVTKKLIKDKNWNEEWEKKYFKPLVVANEFVIRAPFHKNYPKLKFEIVIGPGMAFGTGNHETTLMIMETIIEKDLNGLSVLDMGCGTGILSILASLKGARKITAIDIDEWAYKSASENIKMNYAGNIRVKLGNSSQLGAEKYDFIFANIQKNVLMQDLPVYSGCLNKNGQLLMSGFYLDDFPDIKEKARETGLYNIDIKTKNNWVVSVFKKA
jgi:ribosomal protein L11 methyltransferase